MHGLTTTELLSSRTTIDVLAWMIRAESGGEPLAGKVAVACVPATRLALRPWRYGTDLRAVLLKPYAFSCFNDLGWAERFWPPTPEDYTLARLAAGNLLASPAAGATHYYNPQLGLPYWRNMFTPVATIGRHVFMREER